MLTCDSSKILFYISRSPCLDYMSRTGGVRRSWGSCIRMMQSADLQVLYITFENYFGILKESPEVIRRWESEYDIIHCDDKEILKDMLHRGVKPDVFGYHPRGPGHSEPERHWKDVEASRIGKLTGSLPPRDDEIIRLPGYENNEKQFYDDVKVWRHNPGQDLEEYWSKIHYFRPSIETDLLYPQPKQRKYVLWAGPKSLDMKGRKIFDEVRRTTRLPSHLEWKELVDYKLNEFWQTLDETFLLLNISYHESHCWQLFEAWAKGAPTLYRPTTWGWENGRFKGRSISFPEDVILEGYGGFHYAERTAECISKAISEICELSENEVINAGLRSREQVVQKHSTHKFIDNVTTLYFGTSHDLKTQRPLLDPA